MEWLRLMKRKALKRSLRKSFAIFHFQFFSFNLSAEYLQIFWNKNIQDYKAMTWNKYVNSVISLNFSSCLKLSPLIGHIISYTLQNTTFKNSSKAWLLNHSNRIEVSTSYLFLCIFFFNKKSSSYATTLSSTSLTSSFLDAKNIKLFLA